MLQLMPMLMLMMDPGPLLDFSFGHPSPFDEVEMLLPIEELTPVGHTSGIARLDTDAEPVCVRVGRRFGFRNSIAIIDRGEGRSGVRGGESRRTRRGKRDIVRISELPANRPEKVSDQSTFSLSSF